MSKARDWIVTCLVFCFVPLLTDLSAAAASQEGGPDIIPEDWLNDNIVVEPTPVVDATPSSSVFSRVSFSGYLKNETAYRFNEPRSITKVRNIAYLGAEYPVDDQKVFNLSAWAYHDVAYNLFDYETIAARFVRDAEQPLVFVDNLQQQRDSSVVELREFYLDMFRDRYDLRIGKQYIVWGVLEGIRIVDEVNPQDFRELILPDLLDYRIPLWSLKLDYYADEAAYQFLLIPDIRFHKPAPPGSEWELLQDVPNTQKPETFRFRNAEVGLRLSKELLGSELSLSYFYTWDDFPVIFRTAEINSVLDPVFFPTFTRINMFGMTLVRQAGPAIVKGELVYVPDKYFGLKNDTDQDGDGYLDSQGELQKRHLRWGLGVDFQMWGADFSPAISQWIIFDYNPGLIQKEFDTSATLFVRKPLPEISAVFQLLTIWLVSLDEFYAKPKLLLDITDHFQVAGGFDLFWGQRSRLGLSVGAGGVANTNTTEQSAQFFGNFHDNNRIFVEFKYTF